jgi:hypothetical protein
MLPPMELLMEATSYFIFSSIQIAAMLFFYKPSLLKREKHGVYGHGDC